jgi:succinate dehydrogenase / fumarate reductase, cytochrome b subunit
MQKAIPREFIKRKLHSLFGLGLALFLTEHLLTNSEAALFLGEDGAGFVRMVNFIHSLPYLPFIEIMLIGLPLIFHAYWGIEYLLTSKQNSYNSSLDHPSLGEYKRNHKYTWQRITSWILLIGILAHVVQMRFYEYPKKVYTGEHYYLVDAELDDGLITVSDRLNVKVFDKAMVNKEREVLNSKKSKYHYILNKEFKDEDANAFNEDYKRKLLLTQKIENGDEWVQTLESFDIASNEVVLVSEEIGTAFLLKVREVFKSNAMRLMYSLFVLAACFHAYNGLWTFFISWGFTMTEKSQRMSEVFCYVLMFTLAFLGLASIWGTYLFNLYQ